MVQTRGELDMSMVSKRGSALQGGTGLALVVWAHRLCRASSLHKLQRGRTWKQLKMHGKLLQSEDCDLTSLLWQNGRSKRFLCLSRYLEKAREMARFLRMLVQDAGPASTALWLRDFLCS